MAGPEFFQTTMGHAFYSVHVPGIARSLQSIAKTLMEMQEREKSDPERVSFMLAVEGGEGFTPLADDVDDSMMIFPTQKAAEEARAGMDCPEGITIFRVEPVRDK